MPFLYVVVCASGLAPETGRLISAAQAEGWEVGVVATPHALGFIDEAAVVARTGYPIRSAWRKPGEPKPLPPPDAIVVAPATFNTVNKWAAGISDTLALGILCEAYGLGVPTAVRPVLSAAQAAHPAYAESLARLRSMGVLVREDGDLTAVLDAVRPVLRARTGAGPEAEPGAEPGTAPGAGPGAAPGAGPGAAGG